MNANRLQDYLENAPRRRSCTRIGCTTCGAMDFRRGLLRRLAEVTQTPVKEHFDLDAVAAIAPALAEVKLDGVDVRSAIENLLFDLWSGLPFLDRELEAQIAGSPASEILEAMKAHHAERTAARRRQAEFESPRVVAERREAKRQRKQEERARRMAAQAEHNRRWRAARGIPDPPPAAGSADASGAAS